MTLVLIFLSGRHKVRQLKQLSIMSKAAKKNILQLMMKIMPKRIAPIMNLNQVEAIKLNMIIKLKMITKQTNKVMILPHRPTQSNKLRLGQTLLRKK